MDMPSKLISTALFLLTTACVTKKTSYPDPPFAEAVGDPGFFDFGQWEHRCFVMPQVSPEVFEETLNFYGSKGWQLSGFITDGRKTSQYCIKRER